MAASIPVFAKAARSIDARIAIATCDSDVSAPVSRARNALALVLNLAGCDLADHHSQADRVGWPLLPLGPLGIGPLLVLADARIEFGHSRALSRPILCWTRVY